MTDLPEPKQFGDYSEWPGRAVLDTDGERIGEVREIYLDDATDRPEWVLVERADREPRFVPLANARVENESIRVAQPADRIDAAPGLEPTKQLTLDQERDLYAHYAVELSDKGSESILPAGAVEETTEQPAADEPAAKQQPAADEPAAGEDEPTISDPEPPSAAAPAVTGGGTWSAAAAADEPEADEPAAEIGESEAGGPGGPEAGVAAAAGLAGGADVIQGTGAEVPPAPEDAPMLPPAGETSEPEDRGPMVPPRPEPVAPPPLPPPSSGGPIEVAKKKPVPIAAGGILALLVIFFIIRRRS